MCDPLRSLLLAQWWVRPGPPEEAPCWPGGCGTWANQAGTLRRNRQVLFILSTPLVFVHAYYFGMFLSITIIAYLNGVVLLPVLLSLVGPAEPRRSPGAVTYDDDADAQPGWDVATAAAAAGSDAAATAADTVPAAKIGALRNGDVVTDTPAEIGIQASGQPNRPANGRPGPGPPDEDVGRGDRSCAGRDVDGMAAGDGMNGGHGDIVRLAPGDV